VHRVLLRHKISRETTGNATEEDRPGRPEETPDLESDLASERSVFTTEAKLKASDLGHNQYAAYVGQGVVT